MNSNRKTAIIVGILFLLGFAGVGTVVLTKPILDSTDYLLKISAEHNAIVMGMFFQIVMAFAVAGIGIFLYPILKKYNEGLALGAAGFRIIEAILFIFAAISILSLISLSQEFVGTGAPGASYFQTSGNLLQEMSYWASQVFAPIAWCIGALMYYYVFYKSRLIPRWLSGWGLISATLFLSGAVLIMFGLIESFSPIQVISSIPIALQEMVLAVWLIVKGFNPSAIASESAKM